MTPGPGPQPIRKRYDDYAPKLFSQGREHRRRDRQRVDGGRAATVARKGRASRARPIPPVRAPRQRNPFLLVFAVALGLGISWLAQGGNRAEALAYARPDPRGYRGQVDLVAIERVGTMFYGVVSQGFFLLDEPERREGIDRLIQRLRREGYSSLYLAEASGRTVARWNGRTLEILTDASPGS
jgi:hypothetical protein